MERLPSRRPAVEAQAARIDPRAPGVACLLALLGLLSLLLLAPPARAEEWPDPDGSLDVTVSAPPDDEPAPNVPTEDATSADASPDSADAQAEADAEPATTVEPATVEAARPATTVEPAKAPSQPSEPAEDDVRVSGSIQSRATIQGGDGNDRLSTRLGLEWLAGRWSGGFSLELSNDRGDGALLGRDGVGSLDLTERYVAWTSRGTRPVELRLGTARGVTFGQGLILGSPTFDGLQLVADVTEAQRLIVLAGVTESIDPEDLLDDDLGLFPADDVLGKNGRLLGIRHEIRRGTGLVGVNLVHAKLDGAPAAGLASVDWAFTRGMVDFASEVAVHDGGGWGAFARTSITPSDTWGVTIEGRRYSNFMSPLDASPRYEGLSSSDDQDETGGVVRFDFAPTARFSGTASFDVSRGGDAGPGKSNLRRDGRIALRFALTERTSLAYGFELEDLPDGRDGRVHSLLLTQSFRKLGRLSARFSFDRATSSPRDSMRVSWRCPLRNRKLTVLVDATLRRDEHLTKELQAGFSLRLGSSSFLTCRATVTDDSSESVDVTWYRRF